MKTVFSVVGSTAVGKTDTALQLARFVLDKKLFSGVDVISADSRQVYQGLEILSGADIPENFSRKENHFVSSDSTIRLFGVSFISPDQEWSVAHFQRLALQLIKASWEEKRLPLIVGGTGLYHEHLFTNDPKLTVPPNEEIRKKTEEMSLPELQKWTSSVDSRRFLQMNNSDQNNPRRLVRIIEQAIDHTSKLDTEILQPDLLQTIGLRRTLAEIEKSIFHRVQERFANGAVEEVTQLYRTYPDNTLQSFSTLGVSYIHSYLQKEITKTECIDHWSQSEFAYAKRQITWWKNKPNIKWFSVDQQDYQQEIENYLFSLLS